MTEMNNKNMSAMEEEGKILLESKILMELPDIEETQWKYHPLREEHSCCFSKGNKSRTISFPCETLRKISEEPDHMNDFIQEALAELKRRIL